MLNPGDGFLCSCAGLIARHFSREGDEEKPLRGSWRGLFTGNKAERIKKGREVIGHERFSCLFCFLSVSCSGGIGFKMHEGFSFCTKLRRLTFEVL